MAYQDIELRVWAKGRGLLKSFRQMFTMMDNEFSTLTSWATVHRDVGYRLDLKCRKSWTQAKVALLEGEIDCYLCEDRQQVRSPLTTEEFEGDLRTVWVVFRKGFTTDQRRFLVELLDRGVTDRDRNPRRPWGEVFAGGGHD